MADNIYFLGSFQTFIGVIASVLVLCMFIGGNNMHYLLLRNTRKESVESIKRLQRKLNTVFKSLPIPKSQWPDHVFMADTPQNTSHPTPKFIDDFFGATLNNETISMTPPDLIKEADSLIKHVHDMPLRVSAPVYSLLCCLFLFLADCIVIVWVRSRMPLLIPFIGYRKAVSQSEQRFTKLRDTLLQNS